MHCLIALACLLAPVDVPSADGVVVTVSDADGGLARVGAPASLEMDLATLFDATTDPATFRLVEVSGDGKVGASVPVQWVAKRTGDKASGTLWFLMPPGDKGMRRFLLKVDPSGPPAKPAVAIHEGEAGRYFDITEGKAPVLRYNFGSVPVPAGTPPHFAKGESYERGDYISPLFGLNGETLTDDYPKDHPHHRGVWWSWPVTQWNNEVADIWAVVGVHARPVAVRRTEQGPVLALLEAENVWKWKDRDPIVREEVLVRAFQRSKAGRVVDVEVRLTGLVDGVAIGGRPKHGYGGFSFRAATCQQRTVAPHLDPDADNPCRAWLDYSGLFPGGKAASGLTIFESPANPDYPNPLHQYPACNCVMPAWPADREVPLPRGKTLVLRHRLWIHAGPADAEQLADVGHSYARPPEVRVD